jgi:hypothetical protein
VTGEVVYDTEIGKYTSSLMCKVIFIPLMKNVILLSVAGKERGFKPRKQTLIWKMRYLFYIV